MIDVIVSLVAHIIIVIMSVIIYVLLVSGLYPRLVVKWEPSRKLRDRGLEKYILDEWIIGVMAGYFKGEVYHSLDDTSYVKYSKSIVRRRPIRRVKHIIKKIFKGSTK